MPSLAGCHALHPRGIRATKKVTGDPEHPEVAPEEDVFIRFGQAVAKHPNDIPAEVCSELERILANPDHRVLMRAFAALMVAANVFNNIGKIPLDDSLTAYRPGV